MLTDLADTLKAAAGAGQRFAVWQEDSSGNLNINGKSIGKTTGKDPTLVPIKDVEAQEGKTMEKGKK